MLNTVVTWLVSKLQTDTMPLLNEDDPFPGARFQFEDSPMTRQRLNELLRQTPSLPVEELREPVQLS